MAKKLPAVIKQNVVMLFEFVIMDYKNSFLGMIARYTTNIAATKDAMKQNWNNSTIAGFAAETKAAIKSGRLKQIVDVLSMRKICSYSLPASLALSNATIKNVTSKKLSDTTNP